MPLQIMQNLYTESWLYLTGHCLLNMFIKQCLVAVFYYYHYYLLLLLLFIYFIIIIIINWLN